MKVTNATNPEVIKAYNTNAAQDTSRLNEATRTSNIHQPKRTSVADRVDISTDAKLFNEIREAANSAPDIRMDKVAKVQEAIETGAYKPNLADVASKLLDPDISSRI